MVFQSMTIVHFLRLVSVLGLYTLKTTTTSTNKKQLVSWSQLEQTRYPMCKIGLQAIFSYFIEMQRGCSKWYL